MTSPDPQPQGKRPLIERIFGANWRTTVSGLGTAVFGILTFLSTVSYDSGDISMIVPVEWKPLIAKISASATLILYVWNSISTKDRTVTGGKTVQSVDGEGLYDKK